MAYNVHNFVTGQIIEATPVNEMDEQIKKNETDIGNKLDKNKVGMANGVASLDNSGKVPLPQLPDIATVAETMEIITEYKGVSA